MLTQVAARALAPEIRVNAVMPGPIAKAESLTDAEWEHLSKRVPLRRAGSAGDVARAVLFLLQHDYITGVTLDVVAGGSLV